jgi:hypothetical protein
MKTEMAIDILDLLPSPADTAFQRGFGRGSLLEGA